MGGKKPKSDILKPARELASVVPTKNLDDCLIFFAIILHILLKNFKEKIIKKGHCVGSLFNLLDFELLPLTHVTARSQIKHEAVTAVDPVSWTGTEANPQFSWNLFLFSHFNQV